MLEDDRERRPRVEPEDAGLGDRVAGQPLEHDATEGDGGTDREPDDRPVDAGGDDRSGLAADRHPS